MNGDISETIKDRELGSQILISLPCTQRKLVTRKCYAHFNAHKPTKPVTPTNFHAR